MSSFSIVNRFCTATKHYSDVIMSAMASQITVVSMVCSMVYSGAGSASLTFVRGIHQWPVDAPQRPVTRKCITLAATLLSHKQKTGLEQSIPKHAWSWWRHQMETFSALLAICAGNSPVSGEFPTQRPVTRSFDVYFDLRPNKRLSKQL